MKIKIFFFLLTLTLKILKSQIIDFENMDKSDKDLFDEFVKKYNKKYNSKDELQFRFQIFLKNMRILKAEPEFKSPDGKVLLGSGFGMEIQYKKGINDFIDLTDEEFQEFYLLPESYLYEDIESNDNFIKTNNFQNGNLLKNDIYNKNSDLNNEITAINNKNNSLNNRRDDYNNYNIYENKKNRKKFKNFNYNNYNNIQNDYNNYKPPINLETIPKPINPTKKAFPILNPVKNLPTPKKKTETPKKKTSNSSKLFPRLSQRLKNYRKRRSKRWSGRLLQEIHTLSIKNLKRKVDWKEKKMISSIKNQSRCNSCYAFSVNAAIEAAEKIKYGGEFMNLSEQELLDCSKNYDCRGGQPKIALDYIIENGISFDVDYPYKKKASGSCLRKFRVQVKGRQLKGDIEGRLLQDNGYAFNSNNYGSNIYDNNIYDNSYQVNDKYNNQDDDYFNGGFNNFNKPTTYSDLNSNRSTNNNNFYYSKNDFIKNDILEDVNKYKDIFYNVINNDSKKVLRKNIPKEKRDNIFYENKIKSLYQSKSNLILERKELQESLDKYSRFQIGSFTSYLYDTFKKEADNNIFSLNKKIFSIKKELNMYLKEQKQFLNDKEIKKNKLRNQNLEKNFRIQKLREENLTNIKLREEKLREENFKVKKLREEKLKNQRLQEQKIREQQLLNNRLKEQRIREQQLLDKRIQEQKLLDKKIQEQQLLEKRIRDQQLLEKRILEQRIQEQKLLNKRMQEQILLDKRLKEEKLEEKRKKTEKLKDEKLKEEKLNNKKKLENEIFNAKEKLKKELLEEIKEELKEELRKELENDLKKETFYFNKNNYRNEDNKEIIKNKKTKQQKTNNGYAFNKNNYGNTNAENTKKKLDIIKNEIEINIQSITKNTINKTKNDPNKKDKNQNNKINKTNKKQKNPLNKKNTSNKKKETKTEKNPKTKTEKKTKTEASPKPSKTASKSSESASQKIYTRLKSYKKIKPNILSLLEALQSGPVVVAHFVSNQFKFYSTGIYDGEGCEKNKTVNHATLLVGYDLDADVPYLVLKNSWGKMWGEDGFYRMAIGDLSLGARGTCLVAGSMFNIRPVIA